LSGGKKKAVVQNLNTICLNRKYTDLDSDVLRADDKSHSYIKKMFVDF